MAITEMAPTWSSVVMGAPVEPAGGQVHWAPPIGGACAVMSQAAAGR
jgi:hypothetical protein